MSPILGIIASQNYPRIVTTGFVSIATTTVGSGGASSVTFTGIPSVYKHLQIRGNFIPATTDYSAVFRLNGDSSTSSYVAHTLAGNGGGTEANSSKDYTVTSMRILYTQDINNASISAGFILDILDYASTDKYKTTRALAGIDANGSGRIALASGLWISTSAVNSITLYSATGGYGNTLGSTFRENSKFALYGIQG